jgi:Na+/H+ antiporter NhaB
MNAKSSLIFFLVSKMVYTMITHFINKHVEVLLLKEYLVETLMETELFILIPNGLMQMQLIVQINVLLNVLSKEITVNGTLMMINIQHLSVFFTQEHVLLEQLVQLLLQLKHSKRFKCASGQSHF